MEFRTREVQIARNRDSRPRWTEYSAHRDRITQLLIDSAHTSGGRLLILGAGNCNDVDLHSLLNHFAQIHLFDLDSTALTFGVTHQNLGSNPNVVLHSGDVTGIAEECSKWNRRSPPAPNELDAAMRMALAHTLIVGRQQFDVAASIGLLSQLTEMIIQSLGEDHPKVMELLSAIRLRHMQILLESVRTGGRAILVTEIVSSSTCPELAQVPASQLGDLLRRLIEKRNFFTGLNPAVLESLWRQSPALVPLVEQVEVSRPWLWDFGPRVYACVALRGVRA